MKLEHQASTHHVAERAIRLAPVPGLAQKLREEAAARLGVRRDELADELDVALGKGAAAVAPLHFFHGRGG